MHNGNYKKDYVQINKLYRKVRRHIMLLVKKNVDFWKSDWNFNSDVRQLKLAERLLKSKSSMMMTAEAFSERNWILNVLYM